MITSIEYASTEKAASFAIQNFFLVEEISFSEKLKFRMFAGVLWNSA
jgi:hypothetical protein